MMMLLLVLLLNWGGPYTYIRRYIIFLFRSVDIHRLILILILIMIVLLFLQAVFLPRLYNDFHCSFRTGRALLLLILLSDSGGLDSDTYFAGCYCYSWSYSIRSFVADFDPDLLLLLLF